ncbi:MAG: hypothetical protein PUB41_03450 [bacterium]|nr:hypothetical protein [bacterium]MDD6225293.1 hypothetical protein [bacterium]MDY3861829.1 hypothetical protein [Ruminococcus sp.]
MDILGICVVTVLAIWGLTDIVRKAVVFILKRSCDQCAYTLIIPIEGKCEQAEFILRNAAAELKWNGNKKIKKIYCLLKNADSQTENICKTICTEYDYMEIIYADDMNISEKFFSNG